MTQSFILPSTSESVYIAKNFAVQTLPYEGEPVLWLESRPFWHLTPSVLAWFLRTIGIADAQIRAEKGDLTRLLAPCRLMVELTQWIHDKHGPEALNHALDPANAVELPNAVNPDERPLKAMPERPKTKPVPVMAGQLPTAGDARKPKKTAKGRNESQDTNVLFNNDLETPPD